MEILKSNFKEKSETFLNLLESAKLISFDLEMSGIKGEYLNSSDLPFEHYHKTMNVSKKYQIIQLGLCLFTSSENSGDNLEDLSKNVKAYPFNFYLFPKSIKGNKSKDLGFELEAIEFNVSSGGVDWNKWIADGVPYYNQSNLNALKESFSKDRFNLNKEYAYKLYSEKHEEIYEDLMTRFTAWNSREGNFLETPEDVFDESKHDTLRQNHQMFEANCDFFNAAMQVKRKVVAEFPNVYFSSGKSKESGKDVMFMFKVNETQRKELESLKKQYLLNKFEESTYFSKLWAALKTAIVERKIAVVGHNCTADLQFMMTHFEEWTGSNYPKFKENARNVFQGGMYDTKALSTHCDMGRLGLGDLHKKLLEEGGKEPMTEEGFKFGEGVLHNAGYDAFVTGSAFFNLLSRLNRQIFADLKFKIKYFGSHNFYLDIEKSDKDFILNKNLYGISLREEALKLADSKNKKMSQMQSLEQDFAKLCIDNSSKQNHHWKRKKNGTHDFNWDTHKAFVSILRRELEKGVSSEDYKLLDSQRCRGLGNTYFVFIEVEKGTVVNKVKGVLADLATVMSAEDSYDFLFDLYKKRIMKVNNKEDKK